MQDVYAPSIRSIAWGRCDLAAAYAIRLRVNKELRAQRSVTGAGQNVVQRCWTNPTWLSFAMACVTPRRADGTLLHNSAWRRRLRRAGSCQSSIIRPSIHTWRLDRGAGCCAWPDPRTVPGWRAPSDCPAASSLPARLGSTAASAFDASYQQLQVGAFVNAAYVERHDMVLYPPTCNNVLACTDAKARGTAYLASSQPSSQQSIWKQQQR